MGETPERAEERGKGEWEANQERKITLFPKKEKARATLLDIFNQLVHWLNLALDWLSRHQSGLEILVQAGKGITSIIKMLSKSSESTRYSQQGIRKRSKRRKHHRKSR